MAVTDDQIDAAAREVARSLESMLQRVELVEVARSDLRRPDAPQINLQRLKSRRNSVARRIAQLTEQLEAKTDELRRLDYQITRYRWQHRHDLLDIDAQRSHDDHDIAT